MKAPDRATPTGHELLVGELTVALSSSTADAEHSALPAALAARIAAAGERSLRADASLATTRQRPPEASWRLWSGWLAAAAVLGLWVGTPGRRARETSPSAPPASTPPAATRSAGALRDSLLQNDRALLKLAWVSSTDDASPMIGGDVVWSAAAQRGVMRVVGLAPNDAKRSQYQLWIFDKARDSRYPVDGGVFDIPAGATEVVIPFAARLPVGEAIMFVLTVEAPGGAVVSGRERVVGVAKS